MSGILWTAVGVLGGLSMTAIGDMVSEEVRDRLDHMPQAILRLAARQLDPEQRATVYADEWMPELTYILKGDEARPITRLYHGTRYALGILAVSGRLAKSLNRAAAASAQKDKRPSMRELLLLSIELIASASRAQRIATGVFVLIFVGAAGFFGMVYGSRIVWLNDFVEMFALVSFAIGVPLAFRYRALIVAFVRAVSRGQSA